jgi:L-ascorbate metabolism protein UlaG (beta-lactamase superfamily)
MGDEHTMGPTEAAVATRLLGVRRVVPMHYLASRQDPRTSPNGSAQPWTGWSA